MKQAHERACLTPTLTGYPPASNRIAHSIPEGPDQDKTKRAGTGTGPKVVQRRTGVKCTGDPGSRPGGVVKESSVAIPIGWLRCRCAVVARSLRCCYPAVTGLLLGSGVWHVGWR